MSHPNVCRVHDIDEVEGHTFLSMEYVDDEDLASLLRRIGRFPHFVLLRAPLTLQFASWRGSAGLLFVGIVAAAGFAACYYARRQQKASAAAAAYV